MGDPKSFFNENYDALYYKVTSYVISKCNNICDVEDIVQEVFIEFYELISKKGEEYIINPEAMVIQIAKFKILKHYKVWEKLKIFTSLYKQNEDGEDYEVEQPENIDIPDFYINVETTSEIWKILMEKPQDVQKIFGLFYYCDNTIKEIAALLSISESLVKHKLYRTLEEIRGIYKKDVNLL